MDAAAGKAPLQAPLDKSALCPHANEFDPAGYTMHSAALEFVPQTLAATVNVLPFVASPWGETARRRADFNGGGDPTLLGMFGELQN